MARLGLRAVRLRAAMVIVAVILACSVFTTVVGIYFSTREISQSVSQDLILVGRLASDMIETSITKIKEDNLYVGAMAARTYAAEGRDGLKAALEGEVVAGPSFVSLAVVFPDGTIISSEKEGYGYAKPGAGEAQAFLDAAPLEGVLLGDMEKTADGEPVIRVISRLPEGAVFVSTLRGDYFAQLIASSNYGVYDAGQIFLVDRGGNVIAGGAAQPFDLSAGGGLDGLVAEALAGTDAESHILRFDDADGRDNICAFTPVVHDQERWVLFLTVPVADTPVSKTTEIFIVSGCLFLALGALASIFLSRMQVRPYEELAKKNEELELLREKAEDASHVKSEFLSNMSHEIRTPLNAVIGMTGIGKAAKDAAGKDYALSKIEESSRHLMGVINDILDMSKIEAGKLELSPVVFHFEKMLRQSVDVFAFGALGKQLRYAVEIDPQIPAWLFADEQRLSQVVANLVSNAVKFTPEGGEIHVGAKRIGLSEDGARARIEVSVSDTGIGISEEQQRLLFQAFSQADGSISRRFGGTGLGLTISKNIVEMMDGRIRVHSKVGEGSVFSFTVVCDVAEDPGAALDAADGQGIVPGEFEGRTILLAEDIDINREIVRTLLEPTGVRIEEAENGKVCVERFREAPGRYDLILMDVQMPELDGVGATVAIRAIGTEAALSVPIIAMTANVFREDIEKYLAAGMNAHIGKPINIEQLVAVLRTVIGK
jgi:signal transduction histidine kinase